ncbi:MAG: PilZ domain-containing protein [Acidobacteria bacterium]|nr:PilZ domain-containing protein [Candidatus Sulfomarinibacter kjeldsenii]
MPIQVLMTRTDESTFAKVKDAIRGADIDVQMAPWNDNTLELVQSNSFDAIIIGFPGPITALRRFVQCLRSDGSACQRSGVVLLCEPRHLEAAKTFVGIGAGINRAICAADMNETLAQTLLDLSSVAPRSTLRAPTRVVLHLEQRPLRTFCQTENVSETGMLLRGFGHYPPGTTIDFEINIPGQSDPIRGQATIARTTNVSAEMMEGVGARFNDFRDGDRARLTEYLNEMVH